jgi:hypothetical protein
MPFGVDDFVAAEKPSELKLSGEYAKNSVK